MKPNGTNWRRSRIKALLSSQQAAEALSIKQGSLLNIESNQQNSTVSDLLAARAAALYGVEVDDLLVAGDPDDPQTEPPDQAPQGPKSPKPQRKERAGKSPRRVDNDVRAAS